MEESGHYYSVYYVSIAVGFLNSIASQYAFFAQMPDEVSMLDAYDLEVTYATHAGDLPIVRAIENNWRIRVEHGLHALTGRSAVDEQNRTRQLLLTTRDNDFLRMGLLLHRFGDTYAHTRLNNPDLLYRADPNFTLNPYDGTHGHGADGHEPDEPWGMNRRGLMRRYLTDLYSVFDALAQRTNPINLRPTLATNKVSKDQVIEDFSLAEQAVDALIRRRQYACSDYRRPNVYACFNQDEGAQREYISALRRRITERTSGLSFFSYDPENRGLLTFEQFRNQNRGSYPILDQYDERTLRNAVDQINIDTNTTPLPI